MKQFDFTKLPVGTEVLSLSHGYGKIYHIREGVTYSVSVFFKSINVVRLYTDYGYYYPDNPMPDLVIRSFEIPDEAYRLEDDNER
jgi:hypothetical protein